QAIIARPGDSRKRIFDDAAMIRAALFCFGNDSTRPTPVNVQSMANTGTILLISCYELGHQPLGIVWPRAFLARAGLAADTLDLAVEPWDDAKIRRATLVAIAVPMHTALRLGVRAAQRLRRDNPHCR